MKRISVIVCLSALSLAGALPTAADVAQLGAWKDNTMYSEGNLSNGAGWYCFAGLTAIGNARRALIAFDVAGAVPPGATIESVSLRLFMSRTIAGPESVTLHRALADWGEGSSDAPGEEGTGASAEAGDATWIHTFFPGDTWATPGGDFDPISSASETVIDVGVYTWSSDGMVEDVEDWLENPGANYGWVLLGNENVGPSAKRFDTRENGDAQALLPMLTIEYTPSGEVPATSGAGTVVLFALLLALGTAVVAVRALPG